MNQSIFFGLGIKYDLTRSKPDPWPTLLYLTKKLRFECWFSRSFRFTPKPDQFRYVVGSGQVRVWLTPTHAQALVASRINNNELSKSSLNGIGWFALTSKHCLSSLMISLLISAWVLEDFPTSEPFCVIP